MSPRIVTLLAIGILATACGRAPQSPTTGSIAGTLSGAGGPIQNAEVKLQNYADENCAKLFVFPAAIPGKKT